MPRYLLPSLTKVVLVFVLLGPLLWHIAALLVGFLSLDVAIGIPDVPDVLSVLVGLPMISGAGAFMWWWASFKTNNWFGTLAPTILASLFYWLAMSRLPQKSYGTKRHWIATNISACAVVSAATFSMFVGLGVMLGLDAQPLPADLQSHMNPKSWTTIASWVTTVGFIGALLGAVVGALSKEEMLPNVA